MKIRIKLSIMLSVIFSLTNIYATPVHGNGEHIDSITVSTRPDSHAPLGVMGDHTHAKSEWMLSYRFMPMRMDGLRDGTSLISTEDTLRKYAVAPVRMRMQMHMIGAMFAPHKHFTLMAMTSYGDKFMEMQGDATHEHSHGSHDHPVGAHEMESSGLGDTKLSALIPLLRSHNAIVLLNAGLSIPTGSIAEKGKNGILPYPMQLGSGSFELMPGMTVAATRDNWSFGGQMRVTLPLNENSRAYRRGPMTASTLWSARRLNDWVSISVRALFESWGNISGNDEALNPEMAPTMDPRLQGGARGSLLAGANLNFPDRLGGLLAGQRFAVELQLPLYQHLDGPQMELDWGLFAGWQYAFTLW